MAPPFVPNRRRGLRLMLFSVLAFAANVLILRGVAVAVPQANGVVATLFRGAVGLILVSVFYRGRGFAPRNLLVRPIVLARGMVGGVATLIFYESLNELGAGRAVLLNLTYPVFAAVMAAIWLKERLTAQHVFWMVVALVGMGVFLGQGAAVRGAIRSELFALLGAAVAGGAVVLIRLLNETEHASTIFASQCIWSVVLAWPLCAGLVPALPGLAWAGLVAGSIAVMLGQLALTTGFRDLSVVEGSATQMLLPLVTAAGGAWFFDERFVLTEWIGGMITMWATWRVVCSR